MKRYISKEVIVFLLIILAIAIVFMFVSIDNDDQSLEQPTATATDMVDSNDEPSTGDGIFEYDYDIEKIVNESSDIVVVSFNEEKSDFKDISYLKDTHAIKAEEIVDGKDIILESAREDKIDKMVIFINYETDNEVGPYAVTKFEAFDAEIEKDINTILNK